MFLRLLKLSIDLLNVRFNGETDTNSDIYDGARLLIDFNCHYIAILKKQDSLSEIEQAFLSNLLDACLERLKFPFARIDEI